MPGNTKLSDITLSYLFIAHFNSSEFNFILQSKAAKSDSIFVLKSINSFIFSVS